MDQRRNLRVKAQSVLVSLSGNNLGEPVTAFLRDISEGGIKLQKISSRIDVPIGVYECNFTLPGAGKIKTMVEMLGTGDAREKFGSNFLRLKFIEMDDELKEKISKFIMLHFGEEN